MSADVHHSFCSILACRCLLEKQSQLMHKRVLLALFFVLLCLKLSDVLLDAYCPSQPASSCLCRRPRPQTGILGFCDRHKRLASPACRRRVQHTRVQALQRWRRCYGGVRHHPVSLRKGLLGRHADVKVSGRGLARPRKLELQRPGVTQFCAATTIMGWWQQAKHDICICIMAPRPRVFCMRARRPSVLLVSWHAYNVQHSGTIVVLS